MKLLLIAVAVLSLFAKPSFAGQLLQALKQVREAHPEVSTGPMVRPPHKNATVELKTIGEHQYRMTKSKEFHEGDDKYLLEVEPVLRKENSSSGYGQDLVIRSGPSARSSAMLSRMYTLPVPEGAEVMDYIFDRPFLFLYTIKNNELKMHTYDLSQGSLLAEKNKRTIAISHVQAKEMGLIADSAEPHAEVTHVGQAARGMKIEASK